MVSVHLSVSDVEEVDLKLAVDDGVALTLDGIYVNGHVPAYEGAYEVVPQAFASTTLETEGLRMEQDVTVYEIPYASVSNPEGGLTATIA